MQSTWVKAGGRLQILRNHVNTRIGLGSCAGSEIYFCPQDRQAETISALSKRTLFESNRFRTRTQQGGNSVDTILIVGIDSVVGGNLAATISEQHRVVGLTISTPIAGIDGCEITPCPGPSLEGIRQCIAATQPSSIVHCGPASDSAWQPQTKARLTTVDVSAAGNWARAASESGAHFTLVSSDAVFTGPWMFHTEESTSFCSSESAEIIRAIENETFQRNPNALVVRSNAYGWSPLANGAGWIESLMAQLDGQSCETVDCLGHATPILATDLATILEKCLQTRLEGLFHAAGAERTNRSRFIARLAEIFELPAPNYPTVESPSQPVSGFGSGETSLQSTKIRRELGVALPMLGEGLSRLHQQHVDEYRERLNHTQPQVHDRVA